MPDSYHVCKVVLLSGALVAIREAASTASVLDTDLKLQAQHRDAEQEEKSKLDTMQSRLSELEQKSAVSDAVLESTKKELSQARDESKQSEVLLSDHAWPTVVIACICLLGDVGASSGAAEAVRDTG